ncbi:hypothetical protein AB7M35_001813 [Amorphus suaedae]
MGKATGREIFAGRRAGARYVTAVLAIAAITAIAGQAGRAQAAESGTGFYLLGTRAALAGVVPPPGVYIQNDLYLYSGSASASRDLPIGGRIVADVEATAAIDLLTGLWSTKVPLMGGNLALQATIPVGTQNVSARAAVPGLGLGASIDDDVFTVGDPVVGASIGWHAGNFHWTAGTLVNVPIGDYQEGQIANLAFHRWGMDLYGAATWLDMTRGIDLSAALGVTFNGENPATDYRTGTEFHAEWAATKYLTPAFSLGVAGYYYRQITADSGPGATLGDFKGQVAAIGGTMAYDAKIASTPVSFKAKVYQEFAVENRLQGTSGFLTVSFPLGVGK